MSDERGRPRPAYGEYATPEEVARARGMTLDEYERHLASIAPTRDEEATPDAASARPSEPSRSSAPVAPPRSALANSNARIGDCIVTIALLAFGLLSVVTTIPALLDLGEGLSAAFAAQGLGAYTSFEAARAMGVVAIVVQLLLWLLTLALSIGAVRRGRLSWWIPLLGGVLAVLIVSALGLAAIFIDPAFMRYVDEVAVTV
ncbi:DUF6264 family protein [Salinibacterium sp. SYSU T00001]|uniref:DUF6264 family protein n=1 Tax=Homoserinimonas sedimenticola TaxID=2986805 RepID=UPI002236AD42|nr:DUF6264 family protein [Salinibacterium sedimenticola]MCW4386455.1 DUF6264 family protein [Salinibacterium sedimenticola]